MSTGTFYGQSIDFDEIDQSPSRSHNGGQPVITIIGMTAWSDVDAFIDFLMPVGTSIGGQFGAILNANNYFRVFDYNVEGFGGITTATPNGLNAFQLAKWTIKCHVPMGQNLQLTQPYNTDPVPWLEHEWDAGVQKFTLPRQSLKWASDNKPVISNVTGAMSIPTIEHSITWPKLQNPPFAAIRLVAGCINNAPITFATGTIGLGQALFLGAKCRSELMSDGTLVRTLTYKFSERPLTVPGAGMSTVPLNWNEFPRDDGGAGFANSGWDSLINVNTGQKTYQPSNFASLFPNTF